MAPASSPQAALAEHSRDGAPPEGLQLLSLETYGGEGRGHPAQCRGPRLPAHCSRVAGPWTQGLLAAHAVYEHAGLEEQFSQVTRAHGFAQKQARLGKAQCPQREPRCRRSVCPSLKQP